MAEVGQRAEVPGELVQAEVKHTVVLTAWNRPEYLRPVIESWRGVREVDQAHMVWLVEPGCQEVLDMCRAIDFAGKLNVIENPVRLGELTNPWQALETGFAAGAEFVVLGEDDSAVSSDVLLYFEWCARRFREDSRVLTVLAFQHDQQDGGTHRVLLESRFSSWVWGTWADRWRDCLRDDWDHTYQHKGWDWRIGDHWIDVEGKVSATPSSSRSQHLGRLGVHMLPELHDGYQSACFQEDYALSDFAEV